MTLRHSTHHTHMIPLMTGVLSLILGFPVMAMAMGYGDGHHASGQSMSPHGAGGFGHGQIHHGTSMSGGYGPGGSPHKSGHGPHQSASEFIEHMLKFKEPMAITDDQVAKLQTIKTDFEKTKIKMKAYVAIQRKLLCLIYALWKNDSAFDPEYLTKSPSGNQDPKLLFSVGSKEPETKVATDMQWLH